MKRYQRQIILPEIGQAGQLFLSQAKVFVVGAGGLGTPASTYLAAAGVGEITIIDGDTVSLSNLHRQVLFKENEIGMSKAIVLAEKIRVINPEIKVNSISQYLNKEIALKLFNEFQVIIDGTDNFNAKYLINDVACIFDKPVVFAAISQFEGHLSVFQKSRGPCYRCIFPTPPQSKIQNCAESGVLGPLPGILGTMQAMEALKVLLKLHNSESKLEPAFGKLQIYNFAFNDNVTIPIKQAADCICHLTSFNKDSILEFQAPQCNISKILPQYLIDVRTLEEWNEYHIEGSLHWPLSQIANGELPKIDHQSEYFLICQTGNRARLALESFKIREFKNVFTTEMSVYDYSS